MEDTDAMRAGGESGVHTRLGMVYRGISSMGFLANLF
jgi:hypothetical protein